MLQIYFPMSYSADALRLTNSHELKGYLLSGLIVNTVHRYTEDDAGQWNKLKNNILRNVNFLIMVF